ncbi:Dexamethasone-induced Ras-related protein 1 [Folsomia candida]|uniref:Dexamethasone-induced Ras-related protein 1 n=1 Tax=Folsomia candida TaxID=158441 RepID=A0A226DY44_FOLCA|nr:Dexamethasone-induced Ras-related protein 1 [Folsomia candida]
MSMSTILLEDVLDFRGTDFNYVISFRCVFPEEEKGDLAFKKMIPSRLQRSDTAAMSQTPPRPRTGRRLSLQPQPSLQPSLSPPSSRFRRSPSPTPPKARTTASTPTKGPSKLGYKVMMLGSARVGKTAIIQRFLYDTWTGKYRRTVEEMHRADFPIGGASLTLDILDTSGSYEFPAMKTLNIASVS